MATVEQTRPYTLVVGLGVTGLAVARYLHARGEHLVVVDSRDIPPGMNELQTSCPAVEIHTGSFDEDLFVAAGRIVISPGVPLDEAAVIAAKTRGVDIIGDLDLFAQAVSVPVVGITGSNGKSTVTALLTEMLAAGGLRVAMGGNIGVPVLDLLEQPADLYVLELSSFQLDTLRRLPMLAAVVLNISADHMDRYAGIDDYVASKLGIYRHAHLHVVNLDDARVAGSYKSGSDDIGYTMGEPDEHQYGIRSIDGERHICLGNQPMVSLQAMRLPGDHNVSNALAAMALCDVIAQHHDVDMQAASKALLSFTGLPHRMQWIAEIDACQWYNDSKATNVGAAIAAITGLPGRHVLIAGGEAKDADFTELETVAADHLRAAVLIGRDADKLEAVIGRVVPVQAASSMADAVAAARRLAQPGDNILLSPACASFDMFDNYEHRGDVFVQLVRELQS